MDNNRYLNITVKYLNYFGYVIQTISMFCAGTLVKTRKRYLQKTENCKK